MTQWSMHNMQSMTVIIYIWWKSEWWTGQTVSMTHSIDSPLDKSKNSFQRIPSGNLMGSSQVNGSSWASCFTLLSLWQTLYTNSALFCTNKTGDEKHKSTQAPKNCSACWQVWRTPHQARSLPRKHWKALNWCSHWHGGRSLSHRQQDLCLKAHISPLLAGDRSATALSVMQTPSFTA